MKDYRNILLKAQRQTILEQNDNRKEIIEAFRELWKSKPSEERFSILSRKIVLFPEMLYIMVKEK